MNLDSKEIARYLGSRGADLWPEAAALAADCQRELEGTVTPRTLGRRLSLSLFAGQSRDLDHHLRHCTEGILFAVTLGAETDRLLRRWSAQSMAKAAVGQAVCAVWLDQLCAEYCDSFLPTLDEGQYLTPSFSPGYGDWDLAAQRQVLDLLQAPKRIGLTLTAGGMRAEVYAMPEEKLRLPLRSSGGELRPNQTWKRNEKNMEQKKMEKGSCPMKPLLQAMKERRLYLDGGMGSMLQAAGLPEGLLPDVWGMQNPAAVQGVHRAYLEAGARLITTNTFGTSAPKLVPYGVTVDEVMAAAVANVRQAMQQAGVEDAYVCADLGPSGKLLRPYGDLDFEDAVTLFAETVRAAAKAGF